jgi:hypothetical protein
MVKCELCGRHFRLITASHLKGEHGITTYEYSVMFPLLPMRDANFIRDEDARRESISNSWWSKTLEERQDICNTLSIAQTGKVLSEETKKKISKASSRIQSDPEYRNRHSKIMSPILEEMWTRPKYRELKTEQLTESSRKNWSNPDFRNKILKGDRREPSQDESLITMLLDENFPNQWGFTGHKTFIGGGKRRPDWTHKTLKKVLEYDTYFWHSGYFREDIPEERIKYYADLGYDCLIITEGNLFVKGNLIELVRDFMEKEELPT